VPGVEEVDGGTYRRTLRLDHGAAVGALTPEPGGVRLRLRLDDLRDLTAAVARCRRLLDLDADPVAVSSQLGEDPLLGPLVRAHPGLRVPGCVDGFELAVRAIVGQQVSVAGARTVLGRLAELHGERAPAADREPAPGGLARLFPTPEALAAADPTSFPFPRRRASALVELAQRTAAGELVLDAGADPDEARELLTRIPGVGPWTAGYVAMRALGDPDVFLPGDVGIRHALARLDEAPDDRAWRPWRSYAVMYLWRSLDS
jgi:AraC family transcriptional regulator, regulatory protein of adaptative response / DNA-3-methyladenine glycosylase II